MGRSSRQHYRRGHVDFAVEVDVFDADGAIWFQQCMGVQSQSITVDRQMRRYNVPRVTFVNKCDRSGANPFKVCQQLREKLKRAVLIQIPIGLEDEHEGHVDLVTMKARYFSGDNGEVVNEQDIPAEYQAQADEYREILIDAVSMFDDELMEAAMEGEVSVELLIRGIRTATLDRELTPVFIGSAYKNVGVQALLDGVLNYLPNPTEVENVALDVENDETEQVLGHEPERPLVALAFKLEDGRYGQLTYVRVYQGTLRKGEFIWNIRTNKKVKVGRLVRMHSNSMEDIDVSCGGDLVALFGVDCASGDTFTDGSVQYAMTSMPDPVIQLMIKPVDKAQINMSKALQRFTREDPTLRTYVDSESGETIVAGMGELHLEVYLERMKREYNAEVETGAPQVAYRETIGRSAEFDYTHRSKQVVRVNTDGLSGAWSPGKRRISPSSLRLSAATFRKSISRLSKRASRR